MKPSNTIVVSPKYIEEKERQIADLSKKVERLKKQLKDANDIIDFYFPKTKKIYPICIKPLKLYREKWGVK